jgi:hypothetical protein
MEAEDMHRICDYRLLAFLAFFLLYICILSSTGLLLEKKKDYNAALEVYTSCLTDCRELDGGADMDSHALSVQGIDGPGSHDPMGAVHQHSGNVQKFPGSFTRNFRGEVMLRIAMIHKEMRALDSSMQMCSTITTEPFSDSIRANALCLKVCFLLS